MTILSFIVAQALNQTLNQGIGQGTSTGAIDPMMEYAVKTFSPMWWQTSGMTIIVTALIWVGLRFLRAEHREVYRKLLGWTLILWTIMPPLAHYFIGHWHVRYGLPLQLCDSTGFLAGLAVLTRKQILYEVMLFWSITGATMALLTPQFTQGISWFFLMEFFVSHSILISAPYFLTVHENMRPREWAWLRSFAWLNALAVVVGTFNYIVHANYMFLCKPPTAHNPLIRGEWPYYLVGFELACFVIFMLIYTPFYLKRRKQRNTENAV